MENNLNKETLHTESPRNERMAVRDANGTLFWLDGEALQLYKEGKLDLNSKQRTPEDEARLQSRLEFALRTIEKDFR